MSVLERTAPGDRLSLNETYAAMAPGDRLSLDETYAAEGLHCSLEVKG